MGAPVMSPGQRDWIAARTDAFARNLKARGKLRPKKGKGSAGCSQSKSALSQRREEGHLPGQHF